MNLANQPHQVFNTEALANAAALALRSDDADWTYQVVPDPKGSGRAIIKVYDEDGEFIRNF